MYIEKISDAYNIIEMSIVIAIMGILISSSLTFFQAQSKQAKKTDDQNRSTLIQNALSAYFAKYQRLPCPADPTLVISNTNFGTEYFDSTNTGCAGQLLSVKGGTNPAWPVPFRNQDFGTTNVGNGTTAAGTVNGTIQYTHFLWGAIPTKALGISDNYALDAYGNKYDYIVHESFANYQRHSSGRYKNIIGYGNVQTFQSVPVAFPTNGNVTQDNAICATNNWLLFGDAGIIAGTTATAINNKNRIVFTLCNAQIMSSDNNTVVILLKDSLAYVIIGHGANGLGAWNQSGGYNTLPTNPYELSNSYANYISGSGVNVAKYNFNSITFASNIPLKFYQGTTIVSTTSSSRTFDDNVIWATANSLIQQNLSSSIYCHPSTFYFPPGYSNYTTLLQNMQGVDWSPTNLKSVYLQNNTVVTQDNTMIDTANGNYQQTCYINGGWN